MTITYCDENEREMVAIYSDLSPEDLNQLKKGIPGLTRALIEVDLPPNTRATLALLLRLHEAMLQEKK